MPGPGHRSVIGRPASGRGALHILRLPAAIGLLRSDTPIELGETEQFFRWRGPQLQRAVRLSHAAEQPIEPQRTVEPVEQSIGTERVIGSAERGIRPIERRVVGSVGWGIDPGERRVRVNRLVGSIERSIRFRFDGILEPDGRVRLERPLRPERFIGLVRPERIVESGEQCIRIEQLFRPIKRHVGIPRSERIVEPV
jgi:hypothetical protein